MDRTSYDNAIVVLLADNWLFHSL